jgi:hypothetical protein
MKSGTIKERIEDININYNWKIDLQYTNNN